MSDKKHDDAPPEKQGQPKKNQIQSTSLKPPKNAQEEEEDDDDDQQPVDALSPTLGDESVRMRCPYCGITMRTNIDFVNGYVSYIAVFLILFLFGVFISLFVVPIVFVLSKQLIHKCSACDNEVGTNGKLFYGLNISDRVLTFKLGEMGCIVSRKNLIGVALAILLVGTVYYRVSYMPEHYYGHSHKHEHIFYTEEPWETFIGQCNLQSMMQDYNNYQSCVQTYIDRTVINWDGYVIRVEDYRQSLRKFLHHAVTILVKMQPTEFEELADLVLTFDSEVVDDNEGLLDSLSRGQHIVFNATIKSLAENQQTRHMHVVSIRKTDGFMEIAPHVHHGGRYGDTPRLIRKDTSQTSASQSHDDDEGHHVTVSGGVTITEVSVDHGHETNEQVVRDLPLEENAPPSAPV